MKSIETFIETDLSGFTEGSFVRSWPGAKTTGEFPIPLLFVIPVVSLQKLLNFE